MKKIITIIFAITIFQIPTIFAQTFVENRYFHENNGTLKNTGVYNDKLLFTHEGNMYIVNGVNEPTILTSVSSNMEDNFIRNGGNDGANEFELDNENNVNIINSLDLTTSYRDVAKDNEENYYFVDTDGKLFAYDEDGSHTELYDCGEGYLFTGLTTNNNHIIITHYNSIGSGTEIVKIPKIGGDNIIYFQEGLTIREPVVVKFSDNTEEILLLKQIDGAINVCKVENDGNLTELFEITELIGDTRMSANIDENDNYHVIVTGQNGSLEIIYELETGIENLQNTQISIFPNPTNGIINVETQEQIEKITVLDITGKLILETTNTEIDLSKQKTGTYFLKIETGNGIFTKKIVIE